MLQLSANARLKAGSNLIPVQERLLNVGARICCQSIIFRRFGKLEHLRDIAFDVVNFGLKTGSPKHFPGWNYGACNNRSVGKHGLNGRQRHPLLEPAFGRDNGRVFLAIISLIWERQHVAMQFNDWL